MTSTILAQKLLSVKLSSGEFEKNKWLLLNNMEELNRAKSSLKRVIEKQEENKTCRICLKSGYRRIFGGKDFDTVNSIKNILFIHVCENDGKPQYICRACEVTLLNAEQLKQTAEITQWRLQQEYEMTSSLPMDTDLKRSKHGGYFIERGSKVIREWACGKCRQTFDSQEQFTEHENLLTCHSITTCFVCEICGLALKSITRLKRHRLIHTGELLYPCSHCPYRARTKYALLVHERAHTGVRPIACPHCPAKFLNSSNLASHKRRHMPPAYHCHLCDKKFRFKETLHNHLATKHSTAKPHICSSCGKAFSTRKMICRHERRVHNRPKLRSGILPTYLRQQNPT
ncbi:zinc finger protein 454-like [Trichoplusia ni]|uniref:Zinc finger protein 454-like n=1 Tax=Trichoplusia ni TaxID=7111 RepID=A0A7E5VLE2_TRINI|nr:zinc finger protein 454-like [Trichoplusia ni]